MPDTVIKVENLSKLYRIGLREAGYRTFRETLVDAVRAPLQRLGSLFNRQSAIVNRQSETLWALKDVSFEVKQGEVVGIIGRNGAGKSTLLKILSKITEPTEGRVELRGRVGSLLEVGTGFHPELTGHENIYLYGAILGMDRWEITRKFDEIVSFAELEKFIDTPVKRYSSGMYMRLAFAVAAHLEPEILLVDEVLAVGDAAFQKKCLGKMGDVAKAGRTILFVSHNMAAVLNLCQRALLIDAGTVIADTAAREAVDRYLGSVRQNSMEPLAERLDRRGSQKVRFVAFEIHDSNGKRVHSVRSGQDIALVFRYRSNGETPLRNVHVAIGVHGSLEESLFHLATSTVGTDFQDLPPSGTVICRIANLPLQSGRYPFNLFCRISDEIVDWVQNAGTIDVEAGDFFNTGRLPPTTQGSFMVRHAWSYSAEGLPPETRTGS